MTTLLNLLQTTVPSSGTTAPTGNPEISLETGTTFPIKTFTDAMDIESAVSSLASPLKAMDSVRSFDRSQVNDEIEAPEIEAAFREEDLSKLSDQPVESKVLPHPHSPTNVAVPLKDKSLPAIIAPQVSRPVSEPEELIDLETLDLDLDTEISPNPEPTPEGTLSGSSNDVNVPVENSVLYAAIKDIVTKPFTNDLPTLTPKEAEVKTQTIPKIKLEEAPSQTVAQPSVKSRETPLKSETEHKDIELNTPALKSPDKSQGTLETIPFKSMEARPAPDLAVKIEHIGRVETTKEHRYLTPTESDNPTLTTEAQKQAIPPRATYSSISQDTPLEEISTQQPQPIKEIKAPSLVLPTNPQVDSSASTQKEHRHSKSLSALLGTPIAPKQAINSAAPLPNISSEVIQAATDLSAPVLEERNFGADTSASPNYGSLSASGPAVPTSQTTITAILQATPTATFEAVSKQITTALAQSNGHGIEIRLDPEELGQVRIVLTGKEGVMSVTVFSDKPDVLDLMRRHSDQLELDFSDIGYEGAQFSFEKEPEEDDFNLQEDVEELRPNESPVALRPNKYSLDTSVQLDLRF